eukprot:TRINITY_DN380_c0_g1_i3.p1 TRINITY_DN380_c0_g1~~TRINITY_DN380_c0_g1_i3.p1  ORF type:complete len:193 (-),score=48.85 TRINITY_DN380_c0_g1_i3:92-628(-)
MRATLFLLSLAVASALCMVEKNDTAIPKQYTLFKQCDQRWGSHRLGTSGDTICSAGCAMSSLAMILNTYGEQAGGAIDPGTLNAWLTAHGGYADGDELEWAAANSLGPVKFVSSAYMSVAQLQAAVDKKQPVIVNVRNGGHWVLVVGYDGSTFNVNDPGFSVSTYAYSGMSGFRLYQA